MREINIIVRRNDKHVLYRVTDDMCYHILKQSIKKIPDNSSDKKKLEFEYQALYVGLVKALRYIKPDTKVIIHTTNYVLMRKLSTILRGNHLTVKESIVLEYIESAVERINSVNDVTIKAVMNVNSEFSIYAERAIIGLTKDSMLA